MVLCLLNVVTAVCVILGSVVFMIICELGFFGLSNLVVRWVHDSLVVVDVVFGIVVVVVVFVGVVAVFVVVDVVVIVDIAVVVVVGNGVVVVVEVVAAVGSSLKRMYLKYNKV